MLKKNSKRDPREPSVTHSDEEVSVSSPLDDLEGFFGGPKNNENDYDDIDNTEPVSTPESRANDDTQVPFSERAGDARSRSHVDEDDDIIPVVAENPRPKRMPVVDIEEELSPAPTPVVHKYTEPVRDEEPATSNQTKNFAIPLVILALVLAAALAYIIGKRTGDNANPAPTSSVPSLVTQTVTADPPPPVTQTVTTTATTTSVPAPVTKTETSTVTESSADEAESQPTTTVTETSTVSPASPTP